MKIQMSVFLNTLYFSLKRDDKIIVVSYSFKFSESPPLIHSGPDSTFHKVHNALIANCLLK